MGWRSSFEIYYDCVSNFIKKDDIEKDYVILQQVINFWLQDSSTISNIVEHTEKIRHYAAKCERKKWDEQKQKVQKRCIYNERSGFAPAS